MKVPFYVPDIGRQDIRRVISVLRSKWLTGGPVTAEFERRFAGYIGTRYAVAVNSCTAALHLSLQALGVKSGDEVIVPVFTFAATANAALYCGAKPVFVDVKEDTFNIDPEQVQERITSRTRAIIPVHYGGQPCDMKEILEIAADHKLSVIEDCAHAAGAEYEGKKTGSLGKLGCFSFYPTKPMTTCEGGMVATNDRKLAERIKISRGHYMSTSAYQREKARTWRYDIWGLGYNYRMSEVDAALGLSQLRRLDTMNKERICKARYLTNNLNSIAGLTVPYEAPGRTHIYHLYVVKIERQYRLSRDDLYRLLTNKGIGLSVHYVPLHKMSFYRALLKTGPQDFPVAEDLYTRILSLPMFSKIRKGQVDYVVSQIRSLMT